MSVLQKLEQRAKKCIELRGDYVEQIPSLVAVACFLPGRAKDLSAPTRGSCLCSEGVENINVALVMGRVRNRVLLSCLNWF